MKNICSFSLIIFLIAFFSGCASTKPQPPISYDETKIDPRVSKIGIASTAIPNPNTSFPGAACLLCIAAAELTNVKLTDHVKTLPIEDLNEIAGIIHDRMQKRGLNVIRINKMIDHKDFPVVKERKVDFAVRDYSRLKNEYAVDKILIISILGANVIRNYSGYFPSSPPKVAVYGEGVIINLADGSLEWFLPINITRGVIGEWDEPPSFPGLTNAYFEAIEVTKDAFIKPF